MVLVKFFLEALQSFKELMVFKKKKKGKKKVEWQFKLSNWPLELGEELMFLMASVVEREQVPGEVGRAGHVRQQQAVGRLAGQGGDGR